MSKSFTSRLSSFFNTNSNSNNNSSSSSRSRPQSYNYGFGYGSSFATNAGGGLSRPETAADPGYYSGGGSSVAAAGGRQRVLVAGGGGPGGALGGGGYSNFDVEEPGYNRYSGIIPNSASASALDLPLEEAISSSVYPPPSAYGSRVPPGSAGSRGGFGPLYGTGENPSTVVFSGGPGASERALMPYTKGRNWKDNAPEGITREEMEELEEEGFDTGMGGGSNSGTEEEDDEGEGLDDDDDDDDVPTATSSSDYRYSNGGGGADRGRVAPPERRGSTMVNGRLAPPTPTIGSSRNLSVRTDVPPTPQRRTSTISSSSSTHSGSTAKRQSLSGPPDRTHGPPPNLSSLSSFQRAPLPIQAKAPPPGLPPKSLQTLSPNGPAPPPPFPSYATSLRFSSYPPLALSFNLLTTGSGTGLGNNYYGGDTANALLPEDLLYTLAPPLAPLTPSLIAHLSSYQISLLPTPTSSTPMPPRTLISFLKLLEKQSLRHPPSPGSGGSSPAGGGIMAGRYLLPSPVLEMWSIHDGQDPDTLGGLRGAGGGSGTKEGLVWGLWLMGVEEVEEEWGFWRRWDGMGMRIGGVSGGKSAKAKGKAKAVEPNSPLENTLAPASWVNNDESDHPLSPSASYTNIPNSTQSLPIFPIAPSSMSSCPRGWVRETYSHPAWVPLLTDRCGNYIGVDLDPPPPPPPTRSFSSSSSRSATTSPLASPSGSRAGSPAPQPSNLTEANKERGRGGTPGQVIAFGREIDEKVVIYGCEGPGGWGRFMRGFVEDLEKGRFSSFGFPEGGDDDETRSSGDSSDDGLGDRGYLEEGIEGVDADDQEGGQSTTRNGRTSMSRASKWRLRGEWRKWVDENPGCGGVIGAIAERSRRLWREKEGLLGGSEIEIQQATSAATRPRSGTIQASSSSRSPAGATSSGSPLKIDTNKANRADSLGMEPGVVQSPLASNEKGTHFNPSPATPTAKDPLNTFGNGTMSPPKIVRSPPPNDGSLPKNGSGRSGHAHRTSRSAPPPPMPLDLPTVEGVFDKNIGINRVNPGSDPLMEDAPPSRATDGSNSPSSGRLSFTKALWGRGSNERNRTPNSLLPMVNMPGSPNHNRNNSGDLASNAVLFQGEHSPASPFASPFGGSNPGSPKWNGAGKRASTPLAEVVVPPNSGTRSPPLRSATEGIGLGIASPQPRSATVPSPSFAQNHIETGDFADAALSAADENDHEVSLSAMGASDFSNSSTAATFTNVTSASPISSTGASLSPAGSFSDAVSNNDNHLHVPMNKSLSLSTQNSSPDGSSEGGFVDAVGSPIMMESADW